MLDCYFSYIVVTLQAPATIRLWLPVKNLAWGLTCSGLRPGGIQAYSSRAQPLSLSDADPQWRWNSFTNLLIDWSEISWASNGHLQCWQTFLQENEWLHHYQFTGGHFAGLTLHYRVCEMKVPSERPDLTGGSPKMWSVEWAEQQLNGYLWCLSRWL